MNSTTAVISKIAFGSCHKNQYATGDVWQSIAATQPQAFLWTGDAIYPPTRGIASIQLLQQEYDTLLQNNTIGYNAFRSKLPLGTFGVYDDHDWGGNDVGNSMPHKMQRKKALWQFLGYNTQQKQQQEEQQLPIDRPGAYHSILLGEKHHKVKIIFLDTRWFRQDHCIPSSATKMPLGSGIACLTRWLTAGLISGDYYHYFCSPRTILGEDQWAWLEQELLTPQNDTPKIHIVVSSIQVLTTNPVVESWGHYPSERLRLLRILNGIPGTIILSGDVHYGEILTMMHTSKTKKNDNILQEITSSGLTHSCTKPWLYGFMCQPLVTTFQNHRERSQDYYIGRNFGTIDIDWDPPRRVKVNVHDAVNGSIVLTTGWKSLNRDKLSPSELASVPMVMDGHLRTKAAWMMVFLLVTTVMVVLSRKRRIQVMSMKLPQEKTE